MKIIAKPIEMVVWYDEVGIPHPVRFRIKAEDDSNVVVKIEKVIEREVEKLAGNKMIVFICQSTINGVLKLYEIKYELSTCKWTLFKI
ncbi:hypothetical protein SH2C18_15540 [Clostridium sediminicola]|uniref:hypothetical protein n=1 Tax=Clostridium sediminicola TaxID=3114879 RepID=UPI0031F26489